MISRKTFIKRTGLAGSLLLLAKKSFWLNKDSEQQPNAITGIREKEDLFSFIIREKGAFDLTYYRQLIGAANPFKEGDETLGVAALDDTSRQNARILLSHTKLSALDEHSLFDDEIKSLITSTTDPDVFGQIESWTMGELKAFVLKQPEVEVKKIMPGLSSDIIACLIKD